MENGILLIDKPAGMTSFGVVARVRRILSERAGHKIKVGHTGTLDPFATGLMILTIGSECRHAAEYSKKDKVYETTFELGSESSTGDPEGTITKLENDSRPRLSDIRVVLARFTGEINQTPPVFSAVKIAGRRAYRLAREGQMPVMPSRRITIHNLDLVSYDYPFLQLKAHVSSGTYIRSLAVDIGRALATGAYCVKLRRTKIGEFSVEQAISLEDLGLTP